MAWHGCCGDGVMWAVVWHGIVMLIEGVNKTEWANKKTRMQSRRTQSGQGMKPDGKELFGFCCNDASRQWAGQYFVLVVVAIAGLWLLWLLVWRRPPFFFTLSSSVLGLG